MSSGTPGISSKTKAHRIADELREAVVTGAIAQGTRLYQDELATRFSTSITPVREALRQLHAEGLVEVESHRGVRVSTPDVQQITAIYVLRRLVEPFAARQAAARLSRRDFARARTINEELLSAQQANDQSLARQLNRDFHFLFYRACGLPAVVTEIERFWAMFPWSQLHVVRGPESFREHEQILTAVVQDDHAAIQEHVETHLRNGFLALMQHLRHPTDTDPFELNAL